MPSLSELAGRLLLHLREADHGLTAEELSLRGAGPVDEALAAFAAAGVIRLQNGRYHTNPEMREEMDRWLTSDLESLGRQGRLYFAYGSNMDPDRMYRGEEARVPAARFLCRALLPAYLLVFPRRSGRHPGWVAGVVAGREGEGVWGGLYLVDGAGLQTLDRFEGHPRSYTRESLRVEVQLSRADDWTDLSAVVYVHVDDGSGGGPPAAEYMEHLVRGAAAFGLPRGYQEYLAGIETVAAMVTEPRIEGESRSKYLPLVTYLDGQEKSELRLSFAEMERILGFELPPAAHTYSTPWREAPIGSLLAKHGWHASTHFADNAIGFRRRWDEGPLLKAAASHLGPAEAETFRKLYEWAKEQGTVLPGTGKTAAFTYRPQAAQHSVFSAGADGKVSIHLGWLCRSLPVERVEAVRERLAGLPGAEGLAEPVRPEEDQHGWIALAGLGVEENWRRFIETVKGV